MKGIVKKDFLIISSLVMLLIGFTSGFLFTYFTAEKSLDEAEIKDVSWKYSDDNVIEPVEVSSSVPLQGEKPDKMEDSTVLGRDCVLVFKKLYRECTHTTEERTEIYQLYEGLRYKDILDKFEGWTIETFESNLVTLSRQLDGKCPEHYIAKLVDGRVVIFYEVPQDGKEVYKITNIPEKNVRSAVDREKLRAGLKIETNSALASFLEDYGS